jgi:hypothetical protein
MEKNLGYIGDGCNICARRKSYHHKSFKIMTFARIDYGEVTTKGKNEGGR